MTNAEGDGREPLWIVGVGDVQWGLLEAAADAARTQYGVDARVRSRQLALAEYADGDPPYHGLDLAEWGRGWVDGAMVLVVTDAAIETPAERPAYGLAKRNGKLAIVSTAELGSRREDPVKERLRTEASQHLGYLIGMDACSTDDCLFTVAEAPGDIDRIGPEPCETCHIELQDCQSLLLPNTDETSNSERATWSDGPTERDGFAGPAAVPDPLWVVGVGDVAWDRLEMVAAEIRALFPLDVHLHPDPVGTEGLAEKGEPAEPVHGFDIARYASSEADQTDVLAVTDLDIGHGGTWAFGLSDLDGSLAAVSTSRISEVGDPAYSHRLRALALRHVSHLIGKRACPADGCLFSPADTWRELDALDTEPCRSCGDDIDELRDRLGTARTRGVDGSDSAGGSGSELIHDLVSAGRFWVAIGGYLACFLLTALAFAALSDIVSGVGVPSSDAGGWVLVVAMAVTAYLLYRRLRRWIGRGGRWAVDTFSGAVSENR